MPLQNPITSLRLLLPRQSQAHFMLRESQSVSLKMLDSSVRDGVRRNLVKFGGDAAYRIGPLPFASSAAQVNSLRHGLIGERAECGALEPWRAEPEVKLRAWRMLRVGSDR